MNVGSGLICFLARILPQKYGCNFINSTNLVGDFNVVILTYATAAVCFFYINNSLIIKLVQLPPADKINIMYS